jgi:hypothetical protein
MIVLVYLHAVTGTRPCAAHLPILQNPSSERIWLHELVCISDMKIASTTDHDTAECDEQCVEAISPLALCEPHRKTYR